MASTLSEDGTFRSFHKVAHKQKIRYSEWAKEAQQCTFKGFTHHVVLCRFIKKVLKGESEKHFGKKARREIKEKKKKTKRRVELSPDGKSFVPSLTEHSK